MNDTVNWAIENVRLPKGAIWDFEDRAWQLQILNDDSQRIVCRKPTQVGMSTVFLIKMLHFADQNTCRLLYTLPRQDDVYDMVNSRLHDIITESPVIRASINDIDNVRMKKYKKSWLHFIEMSVPPRMLDADWMLNDEVDLSNSHNLQQAVSRLDASKIRVHHQISTPSIEGYGIDSLYEISDKKQWFINCGYCNYEQTMTWENNVETGKRVYYKCSKCGKPIHPEDIAEGKWIATSGTKSDISGYQISQLMVPGLSAQKLYNEYRTIDRKIFFNNRLGLPYTPQSASFDRETIINTCVSDEVKKKNHCDDGQYVIGCDQGNTLHICVAKVFQNHMDIVFLGTFEDFDSVMRLAKLYNVRFGILDALPNHHSAMKINEVNKKIKLAFFGTAEKIYTTKEDRIYINKTDAYDMLLQSVVDGKIRLYTDNGVLPPEVNTAIAHMCNMRRDIEIQKTNFGGITKFHIWKNVGPDHYADAIIYAMIASDAIASRNRLEAIEIKSDTSVLRPSLNNIFYRYQGKEDIVQSISSEYEGISDMTRIVNHGLSDANPYKNRVKNAN